MLLRIDAYALPGGRCHPAPDAPDGYTNIRVGIQRRGDPHSILAPVSAAVETATWSLECRVTPTEMGLDVTGPYVQGRRGDRFVYLSWLSDEGAGPQGMFRRAKLRLRTVPDGVLEAAASSGTLVCRAHLTDDRGNPRCAGMEPPAVEWFSE